ncbi:hypothetical protein SL267_29070 [Serratia marcescens]|nr:hypothetical protein SL267_29070 [Serratia marcescens]
MVVKEMGLTGVLNAVRALSRGAAIKAIPAIAIAAAPALATARNSNR